MYKYYSFGEKIRNIKAYLYTKLFWKNARLIRIPNFIRNKRNVVYGRNLTTGYNLRIEASDKKKSVFIGNNVVIGDYCHLVGRQKLVIGDNTLIASRVFISDTSHGSYNSTTDSSKVYECPNNRKLIFKNVIIGKNVWIGENVCILPGVFIGDGCIIGANSTITKSFPSNTIIVGNPGKIIKKYNLNKEIWEEYKN